MIFGLFKAFWRLKMERILMKELVKWKESKNRKPLVIHGARQVGKTYMK